MVAQAHKQIEEQFAANLHLRLHRSTPLEDLATADDQGQIMSAETRVRVRRVIVGVARAAQDRPDLDSALQPLFP